MSTTTTPNFGLTMPTPGTGEPIAVSQLNANWTAIDTLARAVACTSGTRPGSPFSGQTIFETDTLLFRMRIAGAWVTVGSLAPTVTSGTRPGSPSPGELHYESDTNAMLVRDSAAGNWRHPSIPIVSSTSLIAVPLAGQIVYDSSAPGLRRYTGSAWVIFNPNADFKWKTATETVTNSTTLQADDHFTWSYVANARYTLEMYIEYVANGPTDGGLKLSFATSTAITYFKYSNFAVNSGGAGVLTQYNVVPETDNPVSPRGIGTNGTGNMSLQPKGTLVTGANAGTMTLNWAQLAATANGTQLLIHSWGELKRIN